MLEATYANAPLEVVLGVEAVHGRADGTASEAPEHAGHDHAAAFATWAWTSTEPLRYQAVRSALAALPASVFRAKGFLHLAESPDEQVVAHVVGRRVEIRPFRPWNGAARRTELVFVSLDADVDQAHVGAQLAATIATEVTRSST